MDGSTSHSNYDVITRVQNTFKHDRTIIINKSIGKGAFGQCFDVTISCNNSYATENMQKSKKALKFIPGEIYRAKRDLIDQEIATHKCLSNQYLVQLYQVNIDPHSNDVHMIMELCDNGSLGDFVARLGPLGLMPDHRNRISSGVCKGLRYLHDEHVLVHRDIKPANILLNQKMSPKISDFGLASTIDLCKINKNKICGTPHYLAPEIFQQKGHSFKSDIWALGITLFHMISGYTPFEDRNQRKHMQQQKPPNSLHQTISRVYRNVLNGRYKFPKSTAPSSKAYIKLILQREPESRPSLTQLLELKFCQINSPCPETPDEDRRYIQPEVRTSIDSFVFISNQPVLDAIEALAQRRDAQLKTASNKNSSSNNNNINISCINLVWVDRWGMSNLSQLYYTLSDGSWGGNLRGVKGILISPVATTSSSANLSTGETHFQNNDLTLTASLAEQFDQMNSHQIKKYCSVIVHLLQRFRIPLNTIEKFVKSIERENNITGSNNVNKTNSNSNNSNLSTSTETVFVFKWSFHSDCIVFLMSNGIWQICLPDHTKLIVNSRLCLLYNGLSGTFNIWPIEQWCLENSDQLDIIRTLLYSIL